MYPDPLARTERAVPKESPTAISRRPLLGTSLTLSALTFAIDPAARGPEADKTTIGILRKARAAGVTTFDIAGARTPAYAETLLAKAFPEPDPTLAILVGRSRDSVVRAPRRSRGGDAVARDVSESLLASLSESRERLGAPTSVVCVWERGSETPAQHQEAVAALDRSRSEGTLSAWALRCAPGAELPAWPSENGAGSVALYEGHLSLLETGLIGPLEERSRRGSIGLLATDPLANGRLDGTRFSSALADRSPGVEPPSIRSLHADFDPILRFGFLTEGHRRTLAQAAVRFALAWPWVTTVSVALPRPEHLAALLASENTPPLTGAEVERIAELNGRSVDGRPSPGASPV